MKTKKLDLLDFKQNELSREDISTIKAGAPIPGDGKPPGGSVGGGSGETNDGITCYYAFDGELLYCQRDDDGSIIVVSAS